MATPTNVDKANIEKHYKESLINQTDDLMWSVSTDYKLLAANDAFVRQFKASTGRSINPGDTVLTKEFPEAALQFYKQLYDRAISGETFREEIQISGSV